MKSESEIIFKGMFVFADLNLNNIIFVNNIIILFGTRYTSISISAFQFVVKMRQCIIHLYVSEWTFTLVHHGL